MEWGTFYKMVGGRQKGFRNFFSAELAGRIDGSCLRGNGGTFSCRPIGAA
jgi:hypothetical protein